MESFGRRLLDTKLCSWYECNSRALVLYGNHRDFEACSRLTHFSLLLMGLMAFNSHLHYWNHFIVNSLECPSTCSSAAQ